MSREHFIVGCPLRYVLAPLFFACMLRCSRVFSRFFAFFFHRKTRREAGARPVLPAAAVQGCGLRDRTHLYGAQGFRVCRRTVPVRLCVCRKTCDDTPSVLCCAVVRVPFFFRVIVCVREKAQRGTEGGVGAGGCKWRVNSCMTCDMAICHR